MQVSPEHVGRAAGKEKEMMVIVICMETGTMKVEQFVMHRSSYNQHITNIQSLQQRS